MSSNRQKWKRRAYWEPRQARWEAYVEVRGNRYSLPATLAGQPVRIRISLDGRLAIYAARPRVLAYKDAARVRLLRRNRVDHARRFRELAVAIAALPVPTLVLDGEVAIFDEQLSSRFELLRHSDPDVVATPPIYIAFDVLYRDGIDLSPRPFPCPLHLSSAGRR